MIKKIIKTSILLTLVGLTVILLFNTGYLRFNYPSRKKFPVRGIDISHHQGNINWNKLKNEKIDFIFIKATEGGDFIDPKFKDNWGNAKKHNYHVGAYHFYRICKTGNEQANNFISIVPKMDDNLPPVIDLEFGGNCTTNKSKDQILQEIQNFLDKLETHYNQVPILYVTTEFYEKYITNKFLKYPLWVRYVYYKKSKILDDREWTFWQFANRGHLQGIDGYVDLNVFCCSKDDLIKIKHPVQNNFNETSMIK